VLIFHVFSEDIMGTVIIIDIIIRIDIDLVFIFPPKLGVFFLSLLVIRK
jgi:hypothetical protein